MLFWALIIPVLKHSYFPGKGDNMNSIMTNVTLINGLKELYKSLSSISLPELKIFYNMMPAASILTELETSRIVLATAAAKRLFELEDFEHTEYFANDIYKNPAQRIELIKNKPISSNKQLKFA